MTLCILKIFLSTVLGSKWFGLAMIVKSLGPVTRIIKDLVPPQKLHLNQLQPFNISDELLFPESIGDDEANNDLAEVLLLSGCLVPNED